MADRGAQYGSAAFTPNDDERLAGLSAYDWSIPRIADREVCELSRVIRADVTPPLSITLKEAPGLLVGALL